MPVVWWLLDALACLRAVFGLVRVRQEFEAIGGGGGGHDSDPRSAGTPEGAGGGGAEGPGLGAEPGGVGSLVEGAGGGEADGIVSRTVFA